MAEPHVSAKIASRSLTDFMGVEVDIDTSKPISRAEFKCVLDLFNSRQVLVFRNQKLSKQQQVDFASRFGRIAGHVLHGWAKEDHPEVHVLSNLDNDGNITGSYPDPNNFAFHTDKSYMPRPALATLLYGVEVPREGGDTLFADMYRAYEALDVDMKARIDNLIAIHSLEKSRTKGKPLSETEKLAAPPSSHHLVQVHPVTQKKFLYCGAHAESIVGLQREEGQTLLDELLTHATRPQFIYAHRWRQGDLVVWDNRCLLHGATMFDIQAERRVMHRVVVERDIAH